MPSATSSVLCATWSVTPASSAALCTSASRLSITLWLTAVTPTRLPSMASATMARAPTYVFPDPGGPLDRQHAAVELAAEPYRGVDEGLARAPERRTDPRTATRR